MSLLIRTIKEMIDVKIVSINRIIHVELLVDELYSECLSLNVNGDVCLISSSANEIKVTHLDHHNRARVMQKHPFERIEVVIDDLLSRPGITTHSKFYHI